MLWLVLLGTALMGAGILLIVLQHDRAGSVAHNPPSSWAVDDHVRTTSFARVEPPTVAVVTVRPNVAPAKPRPLGATPAGWCPPSI
jgi:hypothetical protein